MDDLNVGDKVIYKEQIVVIVDHYGAGNYAIEINGEWLPVRSSELVIQNEAP